MKILLPVDASPGCRQTLDWVSACLEKGTTELYLLNIIPWMPGTVTHHEDSDEVRHILEHYKDFFTQAGFKIAKNEYVFGLRAEAICHYATRENIDQIILGAHGYRGIIPILMGSVSKAVFREARQPVLIVNNTTPPFLEATQPDKTFWISTKKEREEVLIPIDGSLGSCRTLEWAVGFLNPECARIHLIHVFNYTPVLEEREPSEAFSGHIVAQAREYLEKQGFQVIAREIQGSPSASVREYADEQFIDLIIIGSHGEQGPGKFLMGSVSQHVFENANQPVVLLNNTIEPILKISHPEQVGIVERIRKAVSASARQS
jgi:nucleotide-binding universal stress UspA family protein